MLKVFFQFMNSERVRGQAPIFREWRIADLIVLAAAGLLAASIGLGASRTLGFVAAMEQWLVDARLTGFSPSLREPHPRIIIATITEEALATLAYRSPIDRRFVATLVDTLRSKGVDQVGVDLLFDQPTLPEADTALKEALAKYTIGPVIAWADVEDGLTAAQKSFLEAFAKDARVARGWATLFKDRDGTVRSIYPGRPSADTGKWELSFAGAMAAANGITPPRETMGLAYLTREKLRLPVFEQYEAHLIAALPESLFKGKIVLVGVDLPEADRSRTPLAALLGHTAGSLPGVVIHAQALAQLLSDRKLKEIDPGVELLLTILAALLAAIIVMVEVGTGRKLLMGIGSLGLFWIAAGASSAADGPLLPMVAPTMSWFLSTGICSTYVAGLYRDKKLFIRDTFSTFLEPSVVAQLLENPASLNTDGEVRELTILFTDIQDFTSLTEQTSPTILVAMMGEYFDGLCRAVIKHGGTIDKFVGDAVMALFNAPLAVPDHARRAVDTARDIDAFSEQFRPIAESKYGVKLGKTRIGVHTGTAVIGSFGGAQRKNYTAMGDPVNVAARLEAANKKLGTTVCISQATAAKCGDRAFMPIGTVVVRGRTGQIDVWTPVAKADEGSPAYKAYTAAYGLLRQGDPAAAQAMDAVATQYPTLPLARLHAARAKSGAKDVILRLDDMD